MKNYGFGFGWIFKKVEILSVLVWGTSTPSKNWGTSTTENWG